jgi:type IV pilus assembly protein PilN
MIRINLLPVRAAKKKESARQQISIFVMAIAGVLVLALAIYSVTLAKISAANDEIGRSEQEIKRLKEKIGEIDNIKKFQAEVKKKLDILNQLRRDKAGPATRLAKLSDAVPEKLWLTKYTETGGNVSLGGVAFNEDLIAGFMRNLQASGEFINVELGVSEQIDISGMKAKRFEISCSLRASKVADPTTPQKK